MENRPFRKLRVKFLILFMNPPWKYSNFNYYMFFFAQRIEMVDLVTYVGVQYLRVWRFPLFFYVVTFFEISHTDSIFSSMNNGWRIRWLLVLSQLHVLILVILFGEVFCQFDCPIHKQDRYQLNRILRRSSRSFDSVLNISSHQHQHHS